MLLNGNPAIIQDFGRYLEPGPAFTNPDKLNPGITIQHQKK